MKNEAPPRFSAVLLAATLLLLPLVGVGLGEVLVGRSPGTGLQPAFLTGALALAATLLGLRPRLDGDGERLLLALAWTLLGTGALWSLDEMGLAGDAPWAKGLKQGAFLLFLGGLACLPVWILGRSSRPSRTLRRWEGWASLGLLMVSVAGIYQAAAFYLDLPGEAGFARLVASNPSIAAGSDELYLGDRFVGIPRVRSTAAEPLYFGSYLLAVLPATALGLAAARGRGRWWRGGALILGLACLILTFSRGVYLALALQAGLWGLGMWRGVLPRPRTVWWVGAAVGLVAVSLGLAAVFTGGRPWLLPQLLLQRLAQSFADGDLSNLTRMHSWEAAVRIFAAHPLAGVGWGGYGFWFYRVLGPEAGEAVMGWPVTNSVPLRLLAETGAVGTFLWSLVLLRPLAPLRRLLRRPQGLHGGGICAFVLATCVAGMLLQILTFSQLQAPHLWILGGMAAAVAREEGRVA